MTIKEITIQQTRQGPGFAKPTKTELPGAVFDNGKIAYVDADEEICVACDEKALVKGLKQDKGCIEVAIVHKA